MSTIILVVFVIFLALFIIGKVNNNKTLIGSGKIGLILVGAVVMLFIAWIFFHVGADN